MPQHLPVLSRLDRVALVHGPTPFEHLLRLSPKLGAADFFEWADCTGFVTGGNKGRKLKS